MSDNFNKERIIKNTALLYLRMAFTMWLNLYATRLVLKNLGVDDMGVYGVVGSIVSLFAVFSNGITTAIQRFITFELGKADGKVNTIFCTSINIIFLLSGVVFLLLETLGVWYLTNKANIPEESTNAAFWVFQISVLTCIINLISVPYNALIIAHEKMNVFAFISILQVVLSCAAAYCLSFFSNHRLLIYAAILAGIGILVRIIYQVYCRMKFKEAQYYWMIDKECMKEMGKLSGVTTISGILYTITDRGIVLLINVLLGVVANTAYEITTQLRYSIISFSQNIGKAVSPQIIKTYAEKKIKHHKLLVYQSSKVQTFLTYFIIFPLIFKTEFILSVWLDKIPAHTISFTQFIMGIVLINSITNPFYTSGLAAKNNYKFFLYPEIFCLLSIPLGYISYLLFYTPNSIIVTIVIIHIITRLYQTFLATRISVITITEILKYSILPCIIVASLICLCSNILSTYFTNNLLDFCIYFLLNSIVSTIIIFTVGFSKEEKGTIIKSIKNYLKNK